MKYKTLIWSGCSMTYGNGMIDEQGKTTEELYSDKKVEWLHPKFYETFPDVETMQQGCEAVKQISYPMQVGKKLELDTYNLAIGGYGVESQLRKISSFLIKNKNKIDYTKTIVCYQIPALSRVELLNNLDIHGEPRFHFYPFQISRGERGDDTGKLGRGALHPRLEHFFKYNFDFDFYIAKYLMQLVEYRGFLESKGILFLPHNMTEEGFPYEREDEFIEKNMLNFNQWNHVKVDFPNRKSLFKELKLWKEPDFEISKMSNLGKKYYNALSLIECGYNNDLHYSPEGHTILAEVYAKHLKDFL